MAASEGLCDICVTRDNTLVATDWCAECEQSLCKSCKSHHSAATFSRTHQTIPFERFHQLPSFVKDIKNCCGEHEAKFEYFCSTHELPCCVECVKTTHFECRNLTPLHKVVLQYRESTSLADFKCTLSELQGNLYAIVENRKENLSSLVFQKNDCFKKIEEAKNNAVHVLDKIEAELKRQVENSHTKAETVIKVLLKDLYNRKMKVENMQREFQIVKTYASDFQFFMSVRHLGNIAKDIETNLHTVLLKDSAVDNITLSFGSAENRTFENTLPFLGKVEILHENCQVKMLNQRGKQAQLLTVGKSDIDGIQLHPLLDKFKVRNSRTKFDKDVLILDNCFVNDSLVFSDKLNKRLIVYQNNGLFKKNIALSFSPNSIATVTGNQIAVAGVGVKKINIVNVMTGLIEKCYETEGEILSMSFQQEQYCLLLKGIGFCITDSNLHNILRIPQKMSGELSDIKFSVLLNNKIYCAQWSSQKIFCCNLQGEVIWEIINDQVKAPLGISSICSTCNYLVVTGFQSNNIFAFSEDGSKSKELYSSKAISYARAVTFCGARNKLLLSTESGSVFLFDVTFK